MKKRIGKRSLKMLKRNRQPTAGRPPRDSRVSGLSASLSEPAIIVCSTLACSCGQPASLQAPVTFRVGCFPNITYSKAAIGIADGTFQRALGDTQNSIPAVLISVDKTLYQVKTDLLADYLCAELRNPHIPAFQPA